MPTLAIATDKKCALRILRSIKIVIDTVSHSADMIAWHKRMGYEPVGDLAKKEHATYMFIFEKITAERWTEFKERERVKVCEMFLEID
jgi:hypothetical protein